MLGCVMWSTLAQAQSTDASLAVSVVDATGLAVEHAVVSLHTATPTMAAPGTVAIMDQRQLQFAPTVLAIQNGTVVEFPNQDDVRHHVYSFSHPNAFELKLYHGESGNYNQFDHAGVVVLGCNIHDGMLGYLRVVDTPLFGTSDDAGRLSVEAIASGDYEMQIWHPDLGMKLIRRSVSLAPGRNVLTVSLATSARVEPDKKPVHQLQSLFRD